MLHDVLYNSIGTSPTTQGCMARERTDFLLKKALSFPLITVIAGMGAGKTHTIANYLERNSHELRVSWLKLTELDNHEYRLAERFCYAAAKVSPDLAAKLSKLDIPYTEETYKKLFDFVINDRVGNSKIVIVLDNFEVINNPEILIFIQKQALLNIPNFSTIIISRVQPNINYQLLEAKKLVYSIGEDQIKFTKEDIYRYFKMLQIEFTDDLIENIYSYTDGWVFAVDILALLSKNYNASEKQLFPALRVRTFDIIYAEVFNNFSNEIKKILTKLSYFENLPVGLISEISKDNLSVINKIINCNFFIKYNNSLNVYEITQLKKDFLIEQRIDLNNDEILDLYRQAAIWYENNGYKLQAILYFDKINEYDRIFDIMIDFTDYYPPDIAEIFIGIIIRTPAYLLETRPTVQISYTRYLIGKMQIEQAYKILCELKVKYESSPLSTINKSVLGEIYIMFAWISMLARTYDFVDLFKLASEYLPYGSSLINNKTQLVEGNSVCLLFSDSTNEIEKFQEAYSESIPYAANVMNGCGCGLDHLVIAECAYIQGDKKKSEKHAYLAIINAKKENQYGIENMAKSLLIRLNITKGNFLSISLILEDLKKYSQINSSRDNLIQYDIIEGWFYSTIGQTKKIASYIILEPEISKQNAPTVNDRFVVRARCYLAEGKYYELLAFLEQIDLTFRSRNILIINIQLSILKAIASYYVGEKLDAISALFAAYKISHSNLVIMPFIEYGSKMRTLISFAKESGNCNIPKEWLDLIGTKATTYAKQLALVAATYKQINTIDESETPELTKRELEILTHLCHGLTMKQIADSCSLSIHTIKSMLHNIYSKLGAINRIDAVQIATVRKLTE